MKIIDMREKQTDYHTPVKREIHFTVDTIRDTMDRAIEEIYDIIKHKYQTAETKEILEEVLKQLR